MTIPACKKCNNTFSKDEEYFLNILVEIATSERLQSKKSDGGSIDRARKRNPSIYHKISETFTLDKDGRIYLKPELDRLYKVIEKNAVGLYYLKYKKRRLLNDFKCTGLYAIAIEDNRPADIFMMTYTERFKLKKWHFIQWDVFAFIVVRNWKDGKLNMIMNIYNTLWCVIELKFPLRTKSANPQQLGLFSK